MTNDNGEQSPIEAAFLVVAYAAEPGDFEFTIPAGMSPNGKALTTRLAVEFDDEGEAS